MEKVRILLCSALLAVATPAAAATADISGIYDAGVLVAQGGSFALGPGAYEFSLSFSDPVSDFVYGYVGKTTVTNSFCDEGEGEFYCGGDDVPTEPLFEMINPQLYQLSLVVNGPSSYTYPPGSVVVRDDQFDLCCQYGFSFISGEAGRYTLSYAAIPEPRIWSMMILGFGAVGWSIRRSRKRKVAFT